MIFSLRKGLVIDMCGMSIMPIKSDGRTFHQRILNTLNQNRSVACCKIFYLYNMRLHGYSYNLYDLRISKRFLSARFKTIHRVKDLY